MVKVSVIVPVYNPGSHIDDCIRTLTTQSLPTDEYEVIFVDDGSTDATPARLDALAAEHPHVRVEHIPNSGWPGRPRNVGIEMARGEFVFFVDNDDWLAPEALERLHAMAVRDAADIVVGKVVGHGPSKLVPKNLFTRNRSGVTLDWSPLLWLLTPHKLFRRSLLDEHGIRFPEGRRRLEDHLFVVHAFFRASGISVLADYACYHWMLRKDDSNASMSRFDPAGYYANVREALDLVDEHTEPGPFRDRLYVRWYRGKVLGRAGGGPFARWDPEYRRQRYDEIRRLTLERFPTRIDALVPLNMRVRARLLRDDRYDALVALSRREGRLRTAAHALDVRRDGDAVVLDVEARFARRDDLVTFERDGDRLLWAAPEGVAPLDDETRDATAELDRGDLHVFVRSRTDLSEYAVPTEWSLRLEDVPGRAGHVRPVLAGTARFSAAEAAAGSSLPTGDWELLATVNAGGFKATTRVRRGRAGDAMTLRLGADGRVREQSPLLRHRVSQRFPRLARAAVRARKRVGV